MLFSFADCGVRYTYRVAGDGLLVLRQRFLNVYFTRHLVDEEELLRILGAWDLISNHIVWSLGVLVRGVDISDGDPEREGLEDIPINSLWLELGCEEVSSDVDLKGRCGCLHGVSPISSQHTDLSKDEEAIIITDEKHVNKHTLVMKGRCWGGGGFNKHHGLPTGWRTIITCSLSPGQTVCCAYWNSTLFSPQHPFHLLLMYPYK